MEVKIKMGIFNFFKKKPAEPAQMEGDTQQPLAQAPVKDFESSFGSIPGMPPDNTLSEKPVFQKEFMEMPAQSQANTITPSAFTEQKASYLPEKDYEVINAKLDAIKAVLDNLMQRVKTIEENVKSEKW